MDKRGRGNYGEAAAKGYLAAKGFKVLAEKYWADRGEIDLIAKDPGDGYLVFVEVKYRRQTGFGSPGESVTAAKRRAIILAAQQYLAENELFEQDCRFDVIEITGRELLEINHIKNAFWVE